MSRCQVSVCLFILHFPPGSTVDPLPKVVDLEKLSYKCASLVKIGANYVELILGLEILGWKRPICWPRIDLSVSSSYVVCYVHVFLLYKDVCVPMRLLVGHTWSRSRTCSPRNSTSMTDRYS